MGKALDVALPIAAAIFAPELLPALGAFAAPLGAGLAAGGLDYAEGGHNIGNALEHAALGAGGSYLGGQIGNALGGAPAAAGSAAAPAGASAISGGGAIGGTTAGADLTNSAGNLLTADNPFSGAGAGSLAAPSSTVGATLGSGAGQTAGSAGPSMFSSLPSSNLGTIGSNLNALTGPTISGGIGSVIGQGAMNTGVGSALGSTIGSQLAQGLAGPPPSPPPWAPSQAGAMALPAGLSGISGLSPTQQASNLATQGTFGGGLSPQDESYYANLLNRQLVDQSGNVSPISSLSPIESSYNQQLGFGGNTNSTDLLRQLSTWNPTA